MFAVVGGVTSGFLSRMVLGPGGHEGLFMMIVIILMVSRSVERFMGGCW
jgi:hypothetical protein